jgi:VPDSG-CTERM motif
LAQALLLSLYQLKFLKKTSMKMNLIPSKKLALLSAAFCAVMLVFSHNASALTLTVGDNKYLGQLIPGTSGNAQRTAYVNHMIGMGPGDLGLFMGQVFTRSTNNNFGSLPTAVFALNGTNTNISLGTGLYSYLFAQYNLVSYVWYVGNLSGNIQIPGLTVGGLLQGWTLFSAGGQGVPDGGTTVMLLGAALCALGMARRFLTS